MVSSRPNGRQRDSNPSEQERELGELSLSVKLNIEVGILDGLEIAWTWYGVWVDKSC